MGKLNPGSCGITLFCDRRHQPLPEPIHFSSHAEACTYLDRSYAFVYMMVRNGEAVEDRHSSQHITPYAQKCGRESDNWKDSHYTECITDPDHINQARTVALASVMVANRGMVKKMSREVRVYDSKGTVHIEPSFNECIRNVGINRATLHRCIKNNTSPSRGPFKGWRFEYV